MKIKNNLHVGLTGSRAQIAIALTIGLSMFVSNAFAQVKGYFLFNDISISQQTDGVVVDIDRYFKAVMTDFKPEDGEGAVVSFITIGVRSIPVVHTISLEESNWLITPQAQRKAKIDEFKAKLQNGLEQLFATEKKDQSTQLYRGICYGLEHIEDELDSRSVYIVSDFIESSYVLEMGQYADNPQALLSNYDSLKSALIEDKPLPENMENITFTFLCNSEYELPVWATRFFERFFREAGSTVKVKATL